MGWVKLDDAITEHPKLARVGDSAFALYIAGLAYCNRNLTDGFIPSQVGIGQLRYCDGNALPAIRELEETGLWGRNGADGWHVHDYLKYQPSRESVLKKRESTRQRVEKWRSGNAVSTLAPNPNPNPKNPKPKDSSQFERFYAVFPPARKGSRREVRRAWDKAVLRADPESIIAAAERYRDDPNRGDEFTAGGARWLNRDGWEEGPLPGRNAPKPTASPEEIHELAEQLKAKAR